MGLKKMFEKAQTAITFAEAGLFDEAREIMTERRSVRESRPAASRKVLTPGREKLRTLAARG